MTYTKYLAFDLGAESGRAIVGIFDGRQIHLEEVHRFPNHPLEINGHLHWDAAALFKEIKTGLKFAVQKGHAALQSIGIDTWGVDFAFCGNHSGIFGQPYCYRGKRTEQIPEKVFRKIPRRELYNITGIQFLQFNSVFQLYSSNLSGEPALKSDCALLFMPDLFNFLLSVVMKNEYTIASTSQLLNAASRDCDRSIFAALGLPPEITRPVVMPGTFIGKLLPEICAETGLKNVNVVTVASHDTASAIDRYAIGPEQFTSWVAWPKSLGIVMDFNSTFFSHPRATDGFTLSHPDRDIRKFWIEHALRCREISAGIGARAALKAILLALLSPLKQLRDFEAAGKYFERLALLEEYKTLPFAGVWDYYCEINQVPAGHRYIPAVQDYENRILSKRS